MDIKRNIEPAKKKSSGELKRNEQVKIRTTNQPPQKRWLTRELQGTIRL